MAEYSSIVHIYHIFFIHLFIEEHLGYFHILTIVNNASVNLEVHISLWISVLIWGDKNLEVELLSMGWWLLSSHVWLSVTPWTAACQPSLSFTISRSLLKFLLIWVGDVIQPISSSVTSFSSCPQSFQASGSFQMSQYFVKSIGVSVSASVLPKNIQDWFPLGLTDLISLQSEGLSRVFSNTTVQKHQFFRAQASLWSKSLIHTWPLEKSQLWLDGPLLAKLCLLLFSSIFEKTLLFFRVAMPIYISVNSAQTFPFLYILTNTWYFFLMIAILIGVR